MSRPVTHPQLLRLADRTAHRARHTNVATDVNNLRATLRRHIAEEESEMAGKREVSGAAARAPKKGSAAAKEWGRRMAAARKAKGGGKKRKTRKPKAAPKSASAEPKKRKKRATSKRKAARRAPAASAPKTKKRRASTKRAAAKRPTAKRRKTAKRRTSAHGAHLVGPHAAKTAYCESCGTTHSLRQHWSHSAGPHSGAASHSYKKARSAPKKKSARKKHYPADVFYREDARGNWVPIPGRSIPDPMEQEMKLRGGSKRPYYKASAPPKRKINSVEAAKAAIIRQRFGRKRK